VPQDAQRLPRVADRTQADVCLRLFESFPDHGYVAGLAEATPSQAPVLAAAGAARSRADAAANGELWTRPDNPAVSNEW